MKTRVFAAAIAALSLCLLAHPAEARKKHRVDAAPVAQEFTYTRDGRYMPVSTPAQSVRSARRGGSSDCPRNLGCGCNLAKYLHIGGERWRQLWVARAWAREGTRASKGCIGCVAVLSRGRRGGHVGVVQAYDANGNPVIYSYANGRLGWTTAAYPSGRVITYRSL